MPATKYYSGSASVSNGLGDSSSGSISSLSPGPGSRTATGTHRVAIPTGGSATVTMSGIVAVNVVDGTGTPNYGDPSAYGDLSFSLSAGTIAPQGYDPSTVEVESVYMVATYTNPDPPKPPPPSVVPYPPNLSRIPSLLPTTPTIR